MSFQEFYHRCNQIIDNIPQDYEKREFILNSFRGLESSFRFSAPEAFPHRWAQMTQVLSTHLPSPTTETWAERIRQIVAREIDPETSKDWLKSSEVAPPQTTHVQD